MKLETLVATATLLMATYWLGWDCSEGPCVSADARHDSNLWTARKSLSHWGGTLVISSGASTIARPFRAIPSEPVEGRGQATNAPGATVKPALQHAMKAAAGLRSSRCFLMLRAWRLWLSVSDLVSRGRKSLLLGFDRKLDFHMNVIGRSLSCDMSDL